MSFVFERLIASTETLHGYDSTRRPVRSLAALAAVMTITISVWSCVWVWLPSCRGIRVITGQ